MISEFDLFHITMPAAGGAVVKQEILDLNNTIESVLVLAPDLLAVANDNNYAFDTGRHVGVRTPADNELILVKLAAPLE